LRVSLQENFMAFIKNALKDRLPLAVVVTGLCGLVYLTAQQILRMNANDPQIQLVQDTAAALAGGTSTGDLLPTQPVDIAASLSPFLVVYDSSGKPVAGNGTLHGHLPEIPSGIFQYVDQKGEDRVTWQPEPGVRVAAVVVRCAGEQPGFVMAGRSLREFEERVDQLGTIVVIAWLVILAASLMVLAFLEMVIRHKQI
jgi:hypothetical protein